MNHKPASPSPNSVAPEPTVEGRTYMSQEEADRQARIEYLRNIAPPPKRHRRWLRVVLIVIAVLVVLGAAYWFVGRKLLVTKHAAKTTTSQAKPAPAADTNTPIKTAHHDSTNFNLGFDYPTGWTISDTGSGSLTVVSPGMSLKTADSQTVTGQVVVTIQGQQTALPAFQKGAAVAKQNSQKIAYTKPTQGQRAQTYLSFLSYAGSDVSGIDGVYITGDDGYQQGQNIPQSDVLQVNPLVTVTFQKCITNDCKGTASPITLAASSWNATNTLTKSILSILTSLAIQ